MRYAQITDSGYVISDSHLTGKVGLPDMIPIPDDFDLTNKKDVYKRQVSCVWRG